MTDKIKNLIMIFALVLAGACIQGLITKSKIKELEIKAETITLVTNAEKIDSYNAGYRAGKLEAVAELVECDGVENEAVVSMYTRMVNLLRSLGELDVEAFPCGE